MLHDGHRMGMSDGDEYLAHTHSRLGTMSRVGHWGAII